MKQQELFQLSLWMTGSMSKANQLLISVFKRTDYIDFFKMQCSQRLRKVYETFQAESFSQEICEEEIELLSVNHRLLKQILHLPLDSRIAIGLQTVMGMTIDEIAYITSKNITQVTYDLYSGRLPLAQYASLISESEGIALKQHSIGLEGR
ncbi:hypothetical protein [Vibrio maerlii]|uniref:hypothetical protein n=1 Tax=Vibrio maerlii TaxID=2231648 RepID=UPI000E3DD702|nr:hypothetical protein [Vibrio maerlii]